MVECAAELAAAYDPARPERIALIVEERGTDRVRIGFGSRDEVATDLLLLAHAGMRGVEQLAADLAAGEDPPSRKFLCVVVAMEMAACYEHDVMLLELEAGARRP